MKEVLRLLLRIIFAVFYRVEIKGLQNVPAEGPALLCANHLGELDMFFIGYRLKRLIRWVAKAELFKNPLLGAVITWLGAIPIKRGKTDVSSAKNIFRLLREGHIVGIFPEGTRTRGKDLSKIKVKPAFVKYAIESEVPILPVGIKGQYRPFSRIRVTFGKPYYLNANKEQIYSKDEIEQYSKIVMKSIYDLVEES